MGAVASRPPLPGGSASANSSEAVLREVDQLVTQGHSPVHFARQFVRFLRNAIVAKVASGDSPLLQFECFRVDEIRSRKTMLRDHDRLLVSI